jgi:pimeloyl-ACP methyl ester carboxylesterase
VGHSFGGAVVVDVALAHPDRVLSLTLVGAPLLGRAAGIESWSACVAQAQKGNFEEARRAWRGNALFETPRSSPDALLLLEQMVADYACGHWAGSVSERTLEEIAALYEARDEARELELQYALIVNANLDLNQPTAAG